MIMSNSSSTVVVCVSVEICGLVHIWIYPLCVSYLRALCLTIFSHLVVIFQSTLSIHSVIDTGTQSASSLLIQSVTHTIKSRLCVFVSPVVIIFSSVLFLVGKLCHTLNFPVFFWIIFMYFHFICLQFLFTHGLHLCLLFSFPFLVYLPVFFLSGALLLLFCCSLVLFFSSSVPHWCSSCSYLFVFKGGGCL